MPGDHSAISQEGNQRMREDEAHLCLLLLLIQQSLFFSPICPLIALGRDNISNCLALAVTDVGRGWESLLSLSKLSEVASIKLGPLTAELPLLAHADFLCLSFKASSPFPLPMLFITASSWPLDPWSPLLPWPVLLHALLPSNPAPFPAPCFPGINLSFQVKREGFPVWLSLLPSPSLPGLPMNSFRVSSSTCPLTLTKLF